MICTMCGGDTAITVLVCEDCQHSATDLINAVRTYIELVKQDIRIGYIPPSRAFDELIAALDRYDATTRRPTKPARMFANFLLGLPSLTIHEHVKDLASLLSKGAPWDARKK